MKIRKKNILIIVIIAILILSLLKYVQIKLEFSNYLKNKYPEISFDIGMIKYDPLYPKIYAKAKSDDKIEFMIKKPPGSNKIFEHYLREKYELEAIEIIEDFLQNELLKKIDFIRCKVDTEKISYQSYTKEDLINNIEALAIFYKSNSINNLNEFLKVSNQTFENISDDNINAIKDINIYTYTADNLDCDLSKKDKAYTLFVKVVAEEISANEQYLEKRNEIKKAVDNSNLKISNLNISCKGNLK